MKTEKLIVKSQKYIEDNLDEQIDLGNIASNMGYSPYYFSRLFKAHMGVSVMEYVKQRKMIKASDDILKGAKIIDVALNNGYQSHSGFTKAFKNEFGFSPALLRAFKLQTECIGGNTMNHVFMKQTELHAIKEELYKQLLEVIEENKLNYSIEKINNGYKFACSIYNGIRRYSGDEYVTHTLNVAIILAEIGAEEEAVIAGMLCDALSKTNVSAADIASNTSEKIKDILVMANSFDSNNEENTENVVLLKLAQRLHNMRTVEFMDEKKRKQKAEETLELFIPIASKINTDKLKSELNDLAIKYM